MKPDVTEQEQFNREQFDRARTQVKKIKGFYWHLLAYVAINLMIVFLNIRDLDSGESYFQWENFTTLIFWGFGLLVHGLSVFMPTFVLGKNWEERKIKELMDKEKNNRWE